jgi:hypothetical protein
MRETIREIRELRELQAEGNYELPGGPRIANNWVAMRLAYILGAIGLFSVSGCHEARTASDVADERDQQVLEAVLLHILSKPEFDLAGVGPKGTIVIDTQTPGGNRLFRADVMSSARDIGPGHSVPKDVQTNAMQRNGDLLASFSKLRFDPRITLTMLPRSHGRGNGDTQWFQHGNPNGRAWLHAWLPGYSTDGTQAIVRAWIGPSAHGALLTAMLEKKGGKWSVEWYYFDRFEG